MDPNFLERILTLFLSLVLACVTKANHISQHNNIVINKSKKLDSCKKLIDACETDSEIVFLAGKLDKNLLYKKNALGAKIIEYALSQMSNSSSSHFYKVLFLKARYDLLLKNQAEAILSNSKCVKFFENTKDTSIFIASCLNLSRAYRASGNLDSSIIYSIKAYHLNKTRNTNEAAKAAINLSVILNRFGQREKALKYLKEAIQLPTDSLTKSDVILNLASHYYHKYDYDSSSIFFRKALDYDHNCIICFQGLGILARRKKKFEDALDYTFQALRIAHNTANKTSINSIYNNIGRILMNNGQYGRAKSYLDSAYKYSIKDSDDFTATTAYNISLNYMAIGNYDSSEKYNRLHYFFSNHYKEEIIKSKVLELETKYQTEQKEQKIALLEKDQLLKDTQIKNRNQLMAAGGSGAAIAILLALLAIRNQRQKRKAQQALLDQKEIAKKQIEKLFEDQTHRVKNSLMAVSGALYHDKSQAHDETTVYALDKNIARVEALNMIHAKLYEDKTNSQVDLGAYLQDLLQHLVFSFGFEENEINVSLEVHPIQSSSKTAISLSLFATEVFTNSLKHAFGKGRDNKLYVNLKKRENGQAILEIRDNGNGFDISRVEKNGLELMEDQVADLKGELTVNTQNGTSYSLIFNF